MKNTLLKASMVGGAALAALALGAGSASAAATFTVKAGNAPAGTVVPITGTTQGSSPQITFVDTTTGTTLNCASGTAVGSTTVGTGRAGAGIGAIKGPGSKFNGCTGPLGLQLTVTGVGNWTLNAISGNTRFVNATIGAVKANVADTGGRCSFSVRGSVAGQLVNASQTLVLPGTTSKLNVYNVVGCFGLVNNGDVASFKATYKLAANRASYNPLSITTP